MAKATASSFGSLFYVCPNLKCPVGLCYMDTGSAECLGFLRNSSSHFPGLCRLVLTCTHDSLFLRYPAIDIVWRGPVFLALGFLRHLALRGSAWWSPGPGWCSHQSFSRTSVLPVLTLTHALTSYNTPPVLSALASNPYGEFVTVLCLRSHHCLTVSGSTGQWCPMMRNWECGRFLLRLPVQVPPCLPFGSVSACLSPVPQWYPWMVSAAVCGCSSHPAVTLQVDGSRCMWPIRSFQGVPTTSYLAIVCSWPVTRLSITAYPCGMVCVASCQFRSTLPCLPCSFL